jgi:hypothetical protein
MAMRARVMRSEKFEVRKACWERGENGEKGLVGEAIGPRISRMGTNGLVGI